jgi:hypothetical protein
MSFDILVEQSSRQTGTQKERGKKKPNTNLKQQRKSLSLSLSARKNKEDDNGKHGPQKTRLFSFLPLKLLRIRRPCTNTPTYLYASRIYIQYTQIYIQYTKYLAGIYILTYTYNINKYGYIFSFWIFFFYLFASLLV